jgi:EAL domain-containing protein (putative c-di-GMP-specific phosphodiesterase class I)
VATGEVVGFEALMRGVDRDGTAIPAHQLIEPLVEAGMLAGATLQLLRQTIDFLNRCLHEAMPVSASVNVPLGLMSDPAFCRRLVEMVEAASLDPSWITIEITESDAMAEPVMVLENTARIRMYGFNLAIDDFGTAYASFSHLMLLPISELKIERAFVTGLAHKPAAQAMVGACVYLADRLSLRVVAEGVETLEDLAAVRAAGCTYAQGHLIGRPMPPEAAFAWLQGLADLKFPAALPGAPTLA